jgi:hypothetical protein
MTALKILAIVLIGEIAIHVLFFSLSKIFGKDKKDKISKECWNAFLLLPPFASA